MTDTKNIEGKYIAFRDLIINKVSKYVAVHKVFVLCSALLAVTVLLVLILPCPSKSQYLIIRTLSAFSVAGLLSLIPNFFKAKNKWNLESSLLAFFVLLIWNPTSSVINDQCSSSLQISGTVLFAGEPLAGASVKSPELNEVDKTNSNGTFNLPFEKDELNKPIKVIVEFQGLSEQVSITRLTADMKLPIYFQDTISTISDSIALALVNVHIQDRSNQIRHEARRLQRINQGQEISWETLLQKLTAWQQLGGRVDNNISFHNGFWRLDTQWALQNVGLITLPLDFSTCWDFEQPTVYLLNWQYGIRNKQSHSTVKLEYVILEKNPVKIVSASDLRKRARTIGQIRVNHGYPLRFAHITLEYSLDTDWFKESKIRLLGYLPSEQYHIDYEHDQWKITGSKKPGKSS
ncbi:MAG: hypothetical protein Roseis2KO_43800 [Roseivirga sp.]